MVSSSSSMQAPKHTPNNFIQGSFRSQSCFAMPLNKKKLFELAKGFRGRARNCYRIARTRVEKAMQYQTRDRRNKKRDARSLWIQRINAGTREHGVKYGDFIHSMNKQNIWLNRKVLSEIAMQEPFSFQALVEQVKFMRGGK